MKEYKISLILILSSYIEYSFYIRCMKLIRSVGYRLSQNLIDTFALALIAQYFIAIFPFLFINETIK